MVRPPRDDETLDVVFRGHLELLQARRGYRTSVDSMLAAWWASELWRERQPQREPQHIIDLGAGTGLVGLALGRRFPSAGVTLIERQTSLAERASQNIERNGLAGRAEVVLHDLRDGLPSPKAGLAELVASNPPFFLPAGRVLPQHRERRVAHYIDGADIDTFVRSAASLLGEEGTVALVFPWKRRDPLLAALRSGPWSDVVVQPVTHREDGKPPVRVLAGARRRGDEGGEPVRPIEEPRELPPLALHGGRSDDARYHDRIERFLARLGPRC